MSHRIVLRTVSVLALSMLFLGFFRPPDVDAVKEKMPIRLRRFDSESSAFQALVVNSTRNDLSPILSDIRPKPEPLAPLVTEGIEIFNPVLPKALPSQIESTGEGQLLLDTPLNPVAMPAPLLNFDGVSNLFGGWPPDTQGDIGPDHYVQWINLHYAVWRIDKTLNTASLVYGPVPGNSLFQGFGDSDTCLPFFSDPNPRACR